MSNSKFLRVRDFLGGFLVFSVFIVPWFFAKGLFDHRPYTSVEVVSIQRLSNYDLRFNANYINDGTCTLERLEVVGYDLGVWERVDWEGSVGDGMAGVQSMSLILDTNKFYQKYSVKTRHTCKDKPAKVDRTFAEFDSEDVSYEAGE